MIVVIVVMIVVIVVMIVVVIIIVMSGPGKRASFRFPKSAIVCCAPGPFRDTLTGSPVCRGEIRIGINITAVDTLCGSSDAGPSIRGQRVAAQSPWPIAWPIPLGKYGSSSDRQRQTQRRWH